MAWVRSFIGRFMLAHLGFLWNKCLKEKMATWVAWLEEREPVPPLEWWYSLGESSALGELDMNRASALVLGSLFCSLALTIPPSLAQNNSEKLPTFPQLQQLPPLPSLEEPKIQITRTRRDGVFLLSEPNCGPIGVTARMVGQLDSLPSRIVQLNLKNTSSVAIISERFTFHGNSTRDETWPALKQAYAKNLEIERNVTVDAGEEVPVDSLLTGFSDVNHIEVNSVTYADGTSWQPIAGETCIVTPRLL
jgi:hypothetical protein